MVGDYEYIRAKHPDRIPVIIITRDFEITKKKFLIHHTENFSTLFFEIRKHVKTDMRDSILFMVEHQIVIPSQNVGDFHRRVCLQKEDKIMYILIQKNQTFG
jgi:hypothetical protein